MLVRHAMTRGPLAVTPGDTCHAVLQLFRARCIRHAPVLQDGQLVGVVSDRDLLRGLPALIGELESQLANGGTATIANVMTGEPLTCSPNDALDVVARRMQELRIGCMPVVSDGVLIGMLTVTDLLRGFTDYLDGDDVHKLTLLWSSARVHRAPNVAALATNAKVELVALLSSETDLGAHMHLVRVRASEEDFRRFVELCQSDGLLIVGDRAAA